MQIFGKHILYVVAAVLLCGCTGTEDEAKSAEETASSVNTSSAVVESVTDSSAILEIEEDDSTVEIKNSDDVLVLKNSTTIYPSDLSEDEKVLLTYLNGELSTIQVIS